MGFNRPSLLLAPEPGEMALSQDHSPGVLARWLASRDNGAI